MLTSNKKINYKADYYLSGRKRTETWYIKDATFFNVAALENINDLPSYVCYNDDEDNTVFIKKWYSNGIAHRDNGPAIIKYYENGFVLEETWIKNANIHREDDLPAQIAYHDNGKLKDEKWFLEGKFVREKLSKEGETLPTYIRYDYNGYKNLEIWYHKEEWNYMNTLYRFERDNDYKPLPAIICYNEHGDEVDRYYFIYDPIGEDRYTNMLYLFRRMINKWRKKLRTKYTDSIKCINNKVNKINDIHIITLIGKYII